MPIFGSWFWPDGTLRPGTYKIVSDASVSSVVGAGIVMPRGLVQTGQLNTDEALSIRSFVFDSPAANDPDMSPNGFGITITVTPEGAEKETYRLSPSLVNEIGGVNLRLAVFPAPGPLSFRGIPGGVAELDATGKVPISQIPAGSIPAITHDQTIPAASWSITHNLGRLPQVSVYVDGKEILADVEATNTTATVIHATPTAGVAVLV